MELSLISSSHADIDTECLVVGVSENNSVVGSATELDTLISELIDSGDFKPKSVPKSFSEIPLAFVRSD